MDELKTTKRDPMLELLRIGREALKAEGKTSEDPAVILRAALEKNPKEVSEELGRMLKNPQHVTESDSMSLTFDIMSLSKAKPEEMQDRLEKIMTLSSNFISKKDGHSTTGTQLIVDSAKELLKLVQKIVTTMNQKQMGKEPEPVNVQSNQKPIELPQKESHLILGGSEAGAKLIQQLEEGIKAQDRKHENISISFENGAGMRGVFWYADKDPDTGEPKLSPVFDGPKKPFEDEIGIQRLQDSIVNNKLFIIDDDATEPYMVQFDEKNQKVSVKQVGEIEEPLPVKEVSLTTTDDKGKMKHKQTAESLKGKEQAEKGRAEYKKWYDTKVAPFEKIILQDLNAEPANKQYNFAGMAKKAYQEYRNETLLEWESRYAKEEKALADELGYTDLNKFAPQEPDEKWNTMVKAMQDSLPHTREGRQGGLTQVMNATSEFIRDKLAAGSISGADGRRLDAVFTAYRRTMMKSQEMDPGQYQPNEIAGELLNRFSSSPKMDKFKQKYREVFRYLNWAAENGPEQEAFFDKFYEAMAKKDELNAISDELLRDQKSTTPEEKTDYFLMSQGTKWVEESFEQRFYISVEKYDAKKKQEERERQKAREQIKADGWEVVEMSQIKVDTPLEKMESLNKRMQSNKRFGFTNSKEYEAVMKAQEIVMDKYKENPTKAEMVSMRRAYAKLKQASETYLLSRKNPKTDKGKQRYKMVAENLKLIAEIEKKYPMTPEETKQDEAFLRDRANEKSKYDAMKPSVEKKILGIAHQAKERMYVNYLNGKNNYPGFEDDVKSLVLQEHFANKAERREQIGTKYQEYEYYSGKITIPDKLTKELYRNIDAEFGNKLMEKLIFENGAKKLQEACEKHIEEQNDKLLGSKAPVKQQEIPVMKSNDKVKGMN